MNQFKFDPAPTIAAAIYHGSEPGSTEHRMGDATRINAVKRIVEQAAAEKGEGTR